MEEVPSPERDCEGLRAVIEMQIAGLRDQPSIAPTETARIPFMNEQEMWVVLDKEDGGQTCYAFTFVDAGLRVVEVSTDGTMVDASSVLNDPEGCEQLSALHAALFELSDAAFDSRHTDD